MANCLHNKPVCCQCRRQVDAGNVFIVDEKPVCAECLYEGNPPFAIYPIGYVRNKLSRKKGSFGLEGERGRSRIDLFPSQRRFLYGLKDEAFITILYYLHETSKVRSVFNRGLDGKKTGVFASRTPYRLSKIGIQDVALLYIEETTLYVEGLDAVNGTPVLDIKMSWKTNC